jgi:AraC-like DNA-binding protein
MKTLSAGGAAENGRQPVEREYKFDCQSISLSKKNIRNCYTIGCIPDIKPACMSVHVLSESEGNIPLLQQEPTYLWEYKIPESNTLTASGPFGDLLLQETVGSQYAVWYNNYQFKRGERLTITSEEPVYKLRFGLTNSFIYHEAKSAAAPMHERSYNLFYTSGSPETISFKDKAYSNIEIHFSHNYLVAFATHYPHLADWMRKTGHHAPGRLCKVNQIATAGMMACIHDLLNSPYSGELRTIHYDTLVKELLIMALHETATRPLRKIIRFTTKEIESLYDLKNYLRMNMDKPLTPEDLAKTFDATTRTLKRRFFTLFGINLYHFLLEIRMEQASMLLQETDTSIENIAVLTGYRSFANFSTAFKKYYGQSPSYFRTR